MHYKAVGKSVYFKKNRRDRWELKAKTISSIHALTMVKRFEMEQNEWQKKKK